MIGMKGVSIEMLIGMVLAVFVIAVLLMSTSGILQAAFPQLGGIFESISLEGEPMLDVVVASESFHVLGCGLKKLILENPELPCDVGHYSLAKVKCMMAEDIVFEYEENSGKENLCFAYSDNEWRWAESYIIKGHVGGEFTSTPDMHISCASMKSSEGSYGFISSKSLDEFGKPRQIYNINTNQLETIEIDYDSAYTGTSEYDGIIKKLKRYQEIITESARFGNGVWGIEYVMRDIGWESDDIIVHYTLGDERKSKIYSHDVVEERYAEGGTGGPSLLEFVEQLSDTVCFVSDFGLPQTVTDTEAFIRDYGDPKFLVYWQNFPDEENTWTLFGGDEGSEVAVKLAVFTVLGRGKEAIRAGKGKLGTAAHVLFKKPVRSLVVAGTIGAVALFDSMVGRAVPRSNSLVMSIPGADQQEIKLPKEWEGKPVLIKLDNWITERNLNLHFASPCYTKSFKLEKQDVYCKKYIYYKSTGIVRCEGADLDEPTDARCDVKCMSGGCSVRTENTPVGIIDIREQEKCKVNAIVISEVDLEDAGDGGYNYCHYRPGWMMQAWNYVRGITRFTISESIPVIGGHKVSAGDLTPEFTAGAALTIVSFNDFGAGTKGWFMKGVKGLGGKVLGEIGATIMLCDIITNRPDCGLLSEIPIVGDLIPSTASARWPGPSG